MKGFFVHFSLHPAWGGSARVQFLFTFCGRGLIFWPTAKLVSGVTSDAQGLPVSWLAARLLARLVAKMTASAAKQWRWQCGRLCGAFSSCQDDMFRVIGHFIAWREILHPICSPGSARQGTFFCSQQCDLC